jgi:hypothetical protein
MSKEELAMMRERRLAGLGQFAKTNIAETQRISAML